MIDARLSDWKSEMREISSRRALFGQKPAESEHVDAVVKKFKLFGDMWINASQWEKRHHIWMSVELGQLDYEEVQSCFTSVNRVMHKAARQLKNSHPGLATVAQHVLSETETFSADTGGLQLVEGLLCAGMKPHHWDELSHETGITIDWLKITLTEAIERGFGSAEVLPHVVRISGIASKQWAIECQLEQIKKVWGTVQCRMREYKTTGVHVLKGVDEVLAQLDDHIVQLQAMSFSHYGVPFAEEIREWTSKLMLLLVSELS